MAKKTEPPAFEEAIERLETLIEAMESGETPLADLVAKFEEGTKLLQSCQEQLKQAELKIEQLNTEKGTLEPFEDESPQD